MKTKLYIQKRDGRIVHFDKMKIVDAVLAAFKEVDGEETEYALIKAGNIADYIAEEVKLLNDLANTPNLIMEHSRYLNVEEIQDLVEKGLMATKRKDVAKAYILYREARNKERTRNDETTKEVGIKLQASDVKNQNANVDEHSFGGRRGEAAGVIMKKYALDYIISKMARDNHLNNEIYIHDLDSYAVGMHNCLSVPFDDLLRDGFNTRQTDVRPAGSVNTAFQLVAVIFQLQSLQQFGGVSATHLDWTMVPYVRLSFYKHWKDGLHYFEGGLDTNKLPAPNEIKEISITDKSFYIDSRAYRYAMDMTIKEVHQAVEGMYHNLSIWAA